MDLFSMVGTYVSARLDNYKSIKVAYHVQLKIAYHAQQQQPAINA